MQQDNFELACDRLSQVVDGTQFERLRWERNEGPMLARLVQLIQEAIANRIDYELSEEGSSGDIKRFVLKVHGTRIVAICIGLDQGQVIMIAETIERSRFRLTPGEPIWADFADVDAQWMANALQVLFDRIKT